MSLPTSTLATAKLFAELAADLRKKDPAALKEMRTRVVAEAMPQIAEESTKLAIIAVLVRAGLTTPTRFEAFLKEARALSTLQVEAMFAEDPEKAILESIQKLDEWYAAHERAAATSEVPG